MSSGLLRTDAYRMRGQMVLRESNIRNRSTMCGLEIRLRLLVMVLFFNTMEKTNNFQTMVNLKNCLTAGVIMYGAVFALYGNKVIDIWGVSGQQSEFSGPISRGPSAGFSATEGSAGYASDVYSAQEYAVSGKGKSTATGYTGIPSSAFSGVRGGY